LRTLHAVSPLATLERGYAIALDDKGTVLTDAVQSERGRGRHDAIGARLVADDGRRNRAGP
jgi:exonuclease VII large subunit